MKLVCSKSNPCTDITLQDIKLTYKKGTPATSYCFNALGTSLGVIQPTSSFRLSNTSSTTQVKLFTFSDATDSSTTLRRNHLPPFFLIFSHHMEEIFNLQESRDFSFSC
ncbi:hypothetical protein YC2023_097496 [Brassica napus]